MKASPVVPTQIELSAGAAQMSVSWQDGGHSVISYADLRRHCACAWCRAEGKVGRSLDDDRSDPAQQVDDARLMGSTGLQIVFADGHDRGIFPWGYLLAIAEGRGQAFFDERV